MEDYSEWVDSIPADHWDFLEKTRFEHQIPGYHFVHAGLLPPNVSWDMGGWGLDPRLWIRNEFLNSAADFDGRIVVFGHTPQMSGKPLVQPNKIGIDTGAVFGKALTAAIIDPTLAPVAANARFLQILNPDKE
jgi:serine/threonine protein phosphatase 1